MSQPTDQKTRTGAVVGNPCVWPSCVVVRPLAAALFAVAATLVLSCGDSGTDPAAPPAPVATTLSVTPASATLAAIGETVRFTAEVRDQNERPMVGAPVAWSSSDASVASVDAAGLATAAGNGMGTITATSGAASGTASVTVDQVVHAVMVSPAADTLVAFGDTLRLAAEPTDANGHAVAGVTEFAWASSDTLVAKVDDMGLVETIAEGEVVVTATTSGVTGRADLTVVPPLPTTMAVSPDTVRFTAIGQTEQLAAEVREQSGRVMGEAIVSWASGDTMVAAVDSAGLLTAMGGGTTTVTAKVGDVSGDVVVSVMQSAGSVVVSPAESTIASGDTLRLVAEAFDDNGHAVEDAEFVWSSSDVSVVRVDASGLAMGVAKGRATVTAASGDARGTSEITVENPDRAALVAFYEATGGPGWRKSDNWVTDAPLSEWYGIRLDSDGKVVGLHLDGNLLAGVIPPELGDLRELRDIGLAHNELAGPLPPELGNLTDLRSLWLHRNVLTGTIPRSFLHLQLDNFRVGTWSVQWDTDLLCVPGTSDFAGWLRGIETHDIDSERFCNAMDLRVLKSLYDATQGTDWSNSEGWTSDDVAVDQWYGIGADSLGRVTELDLANNGLAGHLPANFGGLSQLTEVRIDGNPLSGPVPLSVAQAPLSVFHYIDTGLCIPASPSLRKWLDAIPSHRGMDAECAPLSDREVLEALYEATGGQNWHNTEGWLTAASLNDWYGVRTDEQNHVFDLRLVDNNLSGMIPPELGTLSELRGLVLEENPLKGQIPAELGNLVNLRLLSLGGNDLTGRIPPELGKLSNLLGLALGWNALKGEIPAELGHLSSLRFLTLARNDLSGTVPSELGNLLHLEGLWLHDNKLLTGMIPPEFGNLSALRELNLSANELTGPIPRSLGNLFNLETLLVYDNYLAGPVPTELGEMSNLRVMGLSHNTELTGSIPASMTALKQMDELLTSNTGLCAPPDPAFHSWLAGIRKHRIPFCADGDRTPAYLIQAAQSLEIPVPLVAGERALLRVFPTSEAATAERIPVVRGRFYRDGRETHVVDIPAKSTALPTEVDESDLSRSANAEIPGHIIQPGLEMVIEIDPDGTLDPALGVTPRVPETGRLAVDVRMVPTFRVTLVPYLWQPAPDSAVLRITQAMSEDPYNHPLFGWTQTRLPVRDMQVGVHEAVMTLADNEGTLLRETAALWAMEGRSGYYIATGTGADLKANAALRGSRVMSAMLDTPFAEYVIAHELGHNMRLEHPPGCWAPSPDHSFPHPRGKIGVWGYDFHAEKLVHPTTGDLMSYCGDQWISDYHFTNALRYRLTDEGTGSTESAHRTTESLLLWGGADTEGVPFLEPAFVVDALPALPQSSGGYQLTGRTARDTELFSLSFDMHEMADSDGGSSFAFVLPVRPGWEDRLDSITLVGPGGSVVLDSTSDLPMAILRNPETGQVRGFLRDPPPAFQATASIAGQGSGLRHEVLFSRGIPDTSAWRR